MHLHHAPCFCSLFAIHEYKGLFCNFAGDSRAVLSRGDVAIPLTDDHKAAREDETVSRLGSLFCMHIKGLQFAFVL